VPLTAREGSPQLAARPQAPVAPRLLTAGRIHRPDDFLTPVPVARPAPRTVRGMFRTLTAPQLAVDIVVGALFFVLCSLVMFGGGGVWGGGASTGWLIVVVLGMSIALTVRRLAPGAALAAAWVIAIVQMAAQVVPNPADVATFAVVYTAAAYGTSLTRWLSLASAVVAPAAITGYILFTQGIGELAMCVQFQ